MEEIMKLKTLPKEIACELLTYIAEKEDFTKVCESLGGEVTPADIKALLREMAGELQKELKTEFGDDYDFRKCKHLSKNVKKIISYLSPYEGKTLLKAFGLTEEK